MRQHKVEVGALDELFGMKSEAIHEFIRLANTRVRGLSGHQDDIEFDEVALALDAVQEDSKDSISTKL